uniref:Uncharacterized protein n=1 Tax=Kalanchoe fedtschenkoi TaxID=63787 RepID=A0A7N0V1G2_KALFE
MRMEKNSCTSHYLIMIGHYSLALNIIHLGQNVLSIRSRLIIFFGIGESIP